VTSDRRPPQEREHERGHRDADKHCPPGAGLVEQRARQRGSELDRSDRDGDKEEGARTQVELVAPGR
jgi:hypothetical protein